MVSLFIDLSKCQLDKRLHLRKIASCRIPYNFEVDSEIAMYNLVPHPGHIFPRDLRISISYLLGYVLCSLSKNMQTPEYGEDGPLIVYEIISFVAIQKIFDLIN